MDINITEVERGLRFFGGPVCVTVVGLAGMAFVDQVTDIQGSFAVMVHQVATVAFLGMLAIFALGIAWTMRRGWLLYRLQRGDLVGNCQSCAGPMAHHSGRYGAYSKCLICGSKREGHY